MMNLKTWTKSVFTIYRHLPRIVRSIDKIFQTKAVNAHFVSGLSVGYNNAYSISQNLIALTERKVKLINLKVLADNVIKSIDREYAKYLILRYVDGFSFDQIANLMNVSSRTVYRKVDRGVFYACQVFDRMGYTADKLNHVLAEEDWLKDVGKDLAKEKRCSDEYLKCLCNRAINMSR